MKRTSIIIVIVINLLVHSVSVDGFCFGLMCGVAPMMSKYCCKLKRYCCQEYQAWLSPIIGTNDFLGEYVEAVAHEVINDQRDPFWRIFSRKVDYDDNLASGAGSSATVAPSERKPLIQEYSEPVQQSILPPRNRQSSFLFL